MLSSSSVNLPDNASNYSEFTLKLFSGHAIVTKLLVFKLKIFLMKHRNNATERNKKLCIDDLTITVIVIVAVVVARTSTASSDCSNIFSWQLGRGQQSPRLW